VAAVWAENLSRKSLRSIEIAGRRFANVTAALVSQASASDLNVGVSLLRHFTITADYTGRAVWLLPHKPERAKFLNQPVRREARWRTRHSANVPCRATL
jgi:hypothetical protein